jgi:effector-binding domain-containing protein
MDIVVVNNWIGRATDRFTIGGEEAEQIKRAYASSETTVVNHIIHIFLAAVFILPGAIDAMAIEEASYKVLEKDNGYEIRDYAPHILAETVVEGDLEEAGNKAFNSLFRYISGDNRSRAKVAMSAPVSQKPAREKITMTAPVGQQRDREKWAVSFMMPASYTLETLPEPEDQKVTLRQVPARRIAAVRYSGFWSEKNYLRYRLELESWIREKGLAMVGDPIWARYDPPYTLWFLRRNEILIPVDGGSK